MAVAATDKGMTWAIRLVCAALTAVLCYVLFKAVITFTNPESVWEQPNITPASVQNSASQGRQSFNFTTDPFNRDIVATPEIIAELGEDAPETTLNLKLTGQTTGVGGNAILLTPDNKSGNYQVGDEVVPGVILQAINKSFIVLDVDGQMQRLTFERNDDTGLIKKMVDSEAPKTMVRVNASSAGAGSKGIAASTAISADVSTLFQNISLRRVMKDGQLTGYSVKANRPGVDLKPFGFSKGDIVTKIGGTDITRGRPDFLALFEKATQSGGTEVTVLRNGQARIIKLGTP